MLGTDFSHVEAGRWFPVPAETPHAGGKNGDKKSRITATFVVEKGKPLALSA